MSIALTNALKTTSEKVNSLIDEIIVDGCEPKSLYDASKYLINAGGKRLRPFLTLKSCEIVGEREDYALPVAAAIELLHNFTLIHDDIMDEDTKRRGVPTTHIVWDTPLAIIAGDLLFAKVYESVIRRVDKKIVSPSNLVKILDLLTEAAITICEGQTWDMMYEKRDIVSEKEYFTMINGKTAALLESSTKAGAIVGGGSREMVRCLGRFGKYCGLAFQLVDDILGLTSDEKTLGKPIGSDIREGKRTLIIVHFFNQASNEEKAKVLSVLGDKTASWSRISNAIKLIDSRGSIEYSKDYAKKLINEAKKQLNIFPTSFPKQLLLDLSDYIISRTY